MKKGRKLTFKRRRAISRRGNRTMRRVRRLGRPRRMSQHHYVRTFTSTTSIVLDGSQDALNRIELRKPLFSGLEDMAGLFHKFRYIGYKITVRPSSQLDGAQFSYLTQNAYATTFFDPFNKFSGQTVRETMNMQYVRRHSPRYVTRAGKPVVVRSDTSVLGSTQNYNITTSPWLDTDDNAPFYCCTLAYPNTVQLNGNTSPATLEIAVRIGFSGRRDPNNS